MLNKDKEREASKDVKNRKSESKPGHEFNAYLSDQFIIKV